MNPLDMILLGVGAFVVFLVGVAALIWSVTKR